MSNTGFSGFGALQLEVAHYPRFPFCIETSGRRTWWIVGNWMFKKTSSFKRLLVQAARVSHGSHEGAGAVGDRASFSEKQRGGSGGAQTMDWRKPILVRALLLRRVREEVGLSIHRGSLSK